LDEVVTVLLHKNIRVERKWRWTKNMDQCLLYWRYSQSYMSLLWWSYVEWQHKRFIYVWGIMAFIYEWL